MTLKEFLINEYGFSGDKAETIADSSRMKNTELVSGKLQEMFAFLGYSKEEQKKVISKWPHVLNLDTKNVKGKADFYAKEYGIKLSQFKQMVKLNFAPIYAANDKVKLLEEYYCNNWGMSKYQFVAKMKRVPGFIGMSSDSVDKKLKEVGLKYHIGYDGLEKLLKSGSNFPCISMEKIDEMADFFKTEFGIEGEDFGKMLVSGKPITYSKEKFISDYKQLQNKFGISSKQYGVMIAKCPTLLGFANDTLTARINKLKELGFDMNTIADHSRALTLSSDKMKSRFLFAKLNGLSDHKFLMSGFMQDSRTVFARMRHVREHNLPDSYVYLTAKKFAKRAGEIDDELFNVDMKLVKEQILKEYNEMNSKNLTMTKEELIND